MGMMDAIMALDQLVDESDPDVDFPNSFHAFQTAEGIRQAHPDKGTVKEDRRRDHEKAPLVNQSAYICTYRLVPVGGSDP